MISTSFEEPEDRWFLSLSGNTDIFMRFSICGLHTLPIIHAALLVKQVMEVQIFKRCAYENLCFYCYRCVYVSKCLFCHRHLSPALCEWLGECVSGRAPGEDSSASSGLHQSFDIRKEQRQVPESPTTLPTAEHLTDIVLCVCVCVCVTDVS